MSNYGPYNERELSDKLVNISQEEMMAFHKERMKKIRWFYIGAIVLAIVSGIFLFFPKLRWISIILAVIGILVFTYGSFKKKRWERLFENLLYLKRKREKTLQQKRASEPQHSGKKYDKIDEYKKKK